MSAHLLLGFDCVLDRSVERTREEWQGLIAVVLAAGGRQRFEDGETQLFSANYVRVAEIYSHVSAP
jgi:hypothetical protein